MRTTVRSGSPWLLGSLLAFASLVAAGCCACPMPHSSIWNASQVEALTVQNATSAGASGLVTVWENDAWRIESIPMHRDRGYRKMAVVTFAYRKTVNEGKAKYFRAVDSHGDQIPPFVGWYAAGSNPGLGDEAVSGAGRVTKSGDAEVKTRTTTGGEGERVYLFDKTSPAGAETYLKHDWTNKM